MLELCGINFGNVLVASGGGNFFRQQPWWFRRVFELIIGVSAKGATHIAKTSTLLPRSGNMPLNTRLQPVEWFPECIKIYPFMRAVLNAVGLSGPGLEYLLKTCLWQEMTRPFFISLMAVGASIEERLKEMRAMALLLVIHKHEFRAKFGIEMNGSRPNTEHCPNLFVDELVRQAEQLQMVGVPVVIKLNALTSMKAVAGIVKSGICDGISLSNTIPFGQLPEWIPWTKLFKEGKSPLAKFGGGGYSGWYLLFIVADFLRRMEEAGIRIPVVAGGGILYPHDVNFLCAASPNNLKAVVYGSVRLLRPWNEKHIVKRANELLGRRK